MVRRGGALFDAVCYMFIRDSTSKFNAGVSLSNWSGTHTIEPDKYYEPSSTLELVKLVEDAHNSRQK